MDTLSIQKFLDLGMQDPKFKHEYLDKLPIPEDDEGDKHFEAKDCNYLCLT